MANLFTTTEALSIIENGVTIEEMTEWNSLLRKAGFSEGWVEQGVHDNVFLEQVAPVAGYEVAGWRDSMITEVSDEIRNLVAVERDEDGVALDSDEDILDRAVEMGVIRPVTFRWWSPDMGGYDTEHTYVRKVAA